MRVDWRIRNLVILVIVAMFMLIPSAVWGLDVEEAPADVTPPTTQAYVPYMAGNHFLAYTDQDVHVTLTSTDNMPGIIHTYYRINAGELQTYGIGPIVFNHEGQYSIEFYSTDASGNEEATKRILIGIDRTAPLTSRSITSGGVTGEQLQYSEDVYVTLTAIDELSGMDGNFPSAARTEFLLAGQEWQRYTTPIVFTTEGVHTLKYRSVDAVTNQEGVHTLLIPIVKPPIVDVTAPYTSRFINFQLGNHYYKYTNAKSVEVTLTPSDDMPGEITTYYRMNAGEYQIYDHTLFLSDEGDYKLDYYSVDAAGNTEEMKSHTFGMDWTAPQTSRLVHSGGTNSERAQYTSPVTVTLSAIDTLSGMIHQDFPPTLEKIEYRISEGAWQKYEAPIEMTAVGEHKLEYRSFDAVGNGEAVQLITIKIVTPPPVTQPDPTPVQPPVTPPSTTPPVTSAPAAPTQIPATEAKGTIKKAEGGEIKLENIASLNIPSGALSIDAVIQIAVVPPSQAPSAKGLKLMSPIIDFTSKLGNKFDKPVTITIQPLESTSVSTSAIYYYHEAQQRWIYVGGEQHPDGSISVAVNHFTQYAIFAYEPTAFVDLETHWSQPYADRLIGMGVIRGFEDGTFRPDETITRSQFVKMIINALGIDVEPVQTIKFVDQANIPDWVREEVAIAVQIGILNGYEDQGSWYFIPQQKITRQEMALILDHTLKYMSGAEVGLNNKLTDISGSVRFTDQADIADWAKDAIQSSINYKLIQGYSDGSFRPRGYATRGEAATMLNKLLAALYM